MGGEPNSCNSRLLALFFGTCMRLMFTVTFTRPVDELAECRQVFADLKAQGDKINPLRQRRPRIMRPTITVVLVC